MGVRGRKLLVLDVNGLLIDTYYEGETRPDRPPDEKVNKFYVYKRPFCDEFIQFCLENFVVGVWSSALEHNVLSLVDYVFKESKGKLAFVWHQQHCTDTGFRHPDNKYKPLFLKELWRLWKNYKSNLPWAEGDFGPPNTLLIDDSAYKAINNPPHTAIFPKTYKATDLTDNYLDGELRTYLEGILESADVQAYLQGHPIGEPSIAVGDPQWSDILNSVRLKNDNELIIPSHLVGNGLAPDHWRRTGAFIPMDATMPHISGEDDHWEHPELVPQGQVNQHGRKVRAGWPRSYPLNDAGSPWDSQPISRANRSLVSDQIPESNWRLGGVRQGLDHRGEHPDQWIGYAGDLAQSGWGNGIPESDTGRHWVAGPRPTETAQLVGNSLSLIPEPMLSLDGRRRVGNDRLDLGTAAETSQINDNLVPPQFNISHVGVHAPGVAYRNGPGEHPDRSEQLKAYHESGSLGSSHWVGGFSEGKAGPLWSAQPRSNGIPHIVPDYNLPSDKRWKRREDRLDYHAAETVRAGKGTLIPLHDDAQPQQGGIQNSRLEHTDSATQMTSDPRNERFPRGWAGCFSADDAGHHMSFQPRVDETSHLVGAFVPQSIPNWQKGAGSKLPSLSDQRLDQRASGTLEATNGDLIPAIHNMRYMSSDGQAYRVPLEGSHWDHAREVMKRKRDHESDRFSPTALSPSRNSPRLRSSYPDRPSRASQRRFDGSGLVVGIDDLPGRSDWPAREQKMFASSLDQSLRRDADETVQIATSGKLKPLNFSSSRIHGDTRAQRLAYDNSAWDHPDHYERGSTGHSGHAIGISDIDDGPPFSPRSRSYEAGQRLLGKSRNADYSSRNQAGEWPSDYENISRGGERAYNNYHGREVYYGKRTSDSEDMERGWHVEQRDVYRGQSRDSYRGGHEDPYPEADGWSREHKDSKRGWSTEHKDFKQDKVSRYMAKDAVCPDDRRASWIDDDRIHLNQQRDRGRARERQEPDGQQHWGSLGHDHRKESQGRTKMEGRDLQRHSDREYRGSKGRHNDNRRLDWGGERDYGKSYQHPLNLNDDWNQSRSSKRRSSYK